MSVKTDVVNLIVNVNGDKSRQQMNELRKSAADLRHEMQGLKKNTQEYRDKAALLKGVEMQMGDLRKQMGLTALSQKELISELKKLQALKNVTTPQTKEFFALQKQIDAVNNRLYEVKNGVFGFGAALHKVKAEIKAFGVLALGYLGFEFITAQFRSMIMGSGALEDKLADVQRVTGMTAREVKGLQEELKAIDTRTAQQELLSLAVTAGKLGVATENIAEFVKSTDMLVTALGDELGDATTITDNLGKIINVYDGAGKITGERTLQIGNAIVSLANAGVASGGFIVDFTKRLGGLAGTANIALNESVGMAAGLEELGQTAETSSTAISTVMVKIGTDVPKYAKLAGQDVQKFAHTLKTAPMEALIQLAEGMKKNKSSFAEVAESFKEAEAAGGRVVSTLGAIGNNGEFLRGKMMHAGTALRDVSEVTDAFALKNNTLGATIDKLGKEFHKMVTSPAVINFLKGAIEGTLSFIKSLADLPAWIERNRTLLILMAGAVGIYTRAKIAKILVDTKDYILLSLMYAQDKALLVITALKTVATRAYTTVVALMTGQLTLATAATRLFAAASASVAGAVGVVIAIVTTVAALWSSFSGKVKESTKSLIDWAGIMQEAATKAGKEIGQLQMLYTAVSNVKLKQDERLSAYQKMQAMYPAILGNLSFEEAITGRLKVKYDELTRAIMGKYILQASESAISDLGKELFEVEKALQGINEATEGSATLAEATRKIRERGFDDKSNDRMKAAARKGFEERKKLIEKSFREIAEFNESIKKKYGVSDADITSGNYTAQMSEEEKKQLANLQKQREAANKKHLEEEKRLQDQIKQLRFELSMFDKSENEQERLRIKQKYDRLIEDATYHAREVFELKQLEGLELAQLQEIINRKIRLDAFLHEQEITRIEAEEQEKRRKQRQDHHDKLDEFDRERQLAERDKVFQSKVDEEEYEEKIRQSKRATLDATINLYAVYDRYKTQTENKQLKLELAANEQRKLSWERLLIAKKISQSTYDREIAKIDAQANARKKAYAEKQLRRQKALAIVAATIDTIQGAVRAYKDYAFPYNLIVSGLIAGAGALQVGYIQSQDVPEGRKGLVVDGPSHEGGGVDLVERNTGRVRANVEGGEPLLVLSRATYRNNKSLIDDLLYSSQYQGGKPVMPKWYSNSSAINMTSVLPALARGGMVQMQPEFSGAITTMKSDMGATNAILLSIKEQLKDAGVNSSHSVKAHVLLQDIQAADALYREARKQGSLKQGR